MVATVAYRRLGVGDAGEVLTVQLAAFVAEARLYGTPEIPPLIETLEDITRELGATVSWGAVRAGRLVGAARLSLDGPVGWISRVAVAPDQQGQGIGSGLLEALERGAPPAVRRFQLAAGSRSAGNVAMYGRRGYQEQSRHTDAAGVEMILMGKDRAMSG